RGRTFGHSGLHSPSHLRHTLKSSVTESLKAGGGHSSDQSKVWRDVATQQAALGVSSGTHAMSDTFAQYEATLAGYRDALRYVPGAVGLAVAIGPQVVSLDLFDKPMTCQKVWERLLSGVMLEAVAQEEAPAPAD